MASKIQHDSWCSIGHLMVKEPKAKLSARVTALKHGGTTHKQRKEALHHQLDALLKLPAQSRYARHRRSVISKALELLGDEARSCRDVNSVTTPSAAWLSHKGACRSPAAEAELADSLAELRLR